MQNHNWPDQPLKPMLKELISLTWGEKLSNHQMKKQKKNKIRNKIAKVFRKLNRSLNRNRK